MIKSDYVSIAATTAGVTGTITTITLGARLLGLNMAMKTADGGIVTAIEIIGTQFPTPIKLLPSMFFNMVTTNCMACAVAPTPLINLERFGLTAKSNTITIKVTSTANETVIVGLMWAE